MAVKIDKNNLEDIIGLTGMQEGLLIYHVSKPDAKQYFDQIVLNISGNIDEEKIKEAWHNVSKANEVLRSVFRWEGLTKPVQVILKNKEIPINVIDVSQNENKTPLIDEIKDHDRNRISLSENPFLISVCRLSTDEALMVISTHRILYDGWSNGIIIKEFLSNYHMLLRGEAIRDTSKTKYKEFIKWYEAQDKNHLLDFWEKYLEQFEVKTALPFSKKVTPSNEYSIHELKVPTDLFLEIEFFLKNNNITLATLIYSAWGILLQQCNDTNDVVFGTTVSGRSSSIIGINDIVGLFINTIPIRIKFQDNESVLQIIKNVEEQVNVRLEYEQCPLALIKNASCIDNKENLFGSIIVIENYPLEKQINVGKALSINSYSSLETTNFDLTIQVSIGENNLEILFNYDNGMFENSFINRIAKYFLNLIKQMIDKPHKKLIDICILSDEEKETIIHKFNGTEKEYPRNKTISYLFEEQAEKTYRKTALQFDDKMMSYGELNERANSLARLLIKNGVKENDKVALMLPRSIELLISMLAVLKSGAICIPLDIEHPMERISFIINDSEAKYIIKAKSVEIKLSVNSSCIVYDDEKINLFENDNLIVSRKADDLAFIIYTSGSTGNPKGTLLSHGGIICHTFTKISVFEISSKDIVANNFSLNVIASLWQIFAPLFCGGKVVLYTGELETDPYKQMLYASKDEITVIELIPSTLNTYLYLIDQGKEKIKLPKLRKIGLTSEETKPRLVNRFYSNYIIPLINCYGQTECSDDVLHYHIPICTNTEIVPVGTTAQNTQILILSIFDQIQPIGIPGEICVSGESLSKGYWNRPDITKEKFICNPLNPKNKMYRTGDIGRWLEDGCVEYLGRLDHQVKIRGNRIELREIESSILKYPEVMETSVIVNEDKNGEKQLCAFFTSDNDLTVRELRLFLSKSLPEYMIPANFMRLDKFPLTANGKIDKKALKGINGNIDLGSEYIAPRNEVEEKIEMIWKELLQKEMVGINDNFFDLGGHSLLMIQLKNKLETTFNKEVSLVDMFNYPTISYLAGYIQSNETVSENLSIQESKISFNGSGKDIAIIGIAMRVPGAKNVDEFWQNLMSGTESISFFAENEIEQSYDDTVRVVPAGGVLGDIDLFDAEFFNITPKEAEITDPQHRIFLEHCWMALEDAGYNPDDFQKSIGVFAGAGLNTYLLNNIISNPEAISSLGEFQTVVCNDKDFLATKVSYKLNLKGPSVTVQTACSTSMVAIHLAKQSLLNGECDMALAGGVSIKVPEKTGYVYSEGGYLSPDGHCYPFDIKAQGTVFSNGVGVVVLKQFDDAVKDRDHIYAVIKGSAINNDGAQKVGYTSPSEIGQIKVINKALSEAYVDKDYVGFIETHGTGTSLGDPIEIAALSKAYKTHDQKTNYCAIGSVKANIGHLDAAAGVTGLIKAAMSLKKKEIPPIINYDIPNPLIDLQNSPFFMNTSPIKWHIEKGLRMAAVSSLGIGGTNAHAILEEAEEFKSSTTLRSYKIIPLSARSETALSRAASNLAVFLKKNNNADLDDIAYTLQTGRKRFDYRLAAICRDANDVINALDPIDPKRVYIQKELIHKPSIVFMFSGVGDHYINMAANLYKTESIFKENIDSACEICMQYLEVDLRSIIFNSQAHTNTKSLFGISADENLNELQKTMYSQTAVFIIEFALAKLWISWGVSPDVMIGYSIGEYTAACISGVFSLEDALLIVCHRSKLIDNSENGAMLAVSMSETEMTPFMTRNLSMAAQNTPDLCVVSGSISDIKILEQKLSDKEIVYQRVKTNHAFHSHMMKPLEKDIRKLFEGIKLNHPQTPYISNVTGTWIIPEQATSVDYWIKHTVSSIRFSDGVSELLKEDYNIFLEIGPGNSLTSFVFQHPRIDAKKERYIFTSLPNKNDSFTDDYLIAKTLGRLWIAGVNINWEMYYRFESRNRVALPTYPFEHKSHWVFPYEENHATASRSTKSHINNINEWFYVPTWKQSHISFHKKNQTNRSWLIFVDDVNIGTTLALKLGQTGDTVIIVEKGNGFSVIDDRVYSINPCNPNDYFDLIKDIRKKDDYFDAVVHMWSVTERNEKNSEKYSISEHLNQGIYSLLYLTQALLKSSMFDDIRFWVISSHLNIIESTDKCNPAKATILSACKVISQEYPHITCSNIDIGNINSDYFNTDITTDKLVSELTSNSQDTNIAYRNNIRWIKVYEKEKFKSAPESLVLKDKGVYVITGGLGNIGLTLANFFANTTKAKLVLITRSEFPAKPEWNTISVEKNHPLNAKVVKLVEMERLGAEVVVLQADCATEEEMQDAFKIAEEKFGTINGIIHAAGVTNLDSFKTIPELNKQYCEEHFQSKIYGTIVLEKLLENRNIDFCILFSSLSSFLGGLGFYSYSAANSFMDMFAESHDNDKWLSINWGVWNFDKEKIKGIGSTISDLNIDVEQGTEAFGKALTLAGNLKHFIVSSSDFNAQLEQWSFIKNKTHELKAQNNTVHARPHLSTMYSPPDRECEKVLTVLWEQLIGIDSIGVYDNFFELGGHSLMATKLVSRIREIFKIDFSLKQFFDDPTVRGATNKIDMIWESCEIVDEIAKTYNEAEALATQ